MDTLAQWVVSGVLALVTMLGNPAMVPDTEGGPVPSIFISVTPDPMVAGQQAEISYDFAAAGQSGPITLHIKFALLDGTVSTMQVQLDKNDPSAQINVPGDAAAVNIVDGSHVSEDYGGAVSPPPVGG